MYGVYGVQDQTENSFIYNLPKNEAKQWITTKQHSQFNFDFNCKIPHSVNIVVTNLNDLSQTFFKKCMLSVTYVTYINKEFIYNCWYVVMKLHYQI